MIIEMAVSPDVYSQKQTDESVTETTCNTRL